jgi:hypothetical protein
MSLSNFGMLGAIGETMALLGLALLWTYRAQAECWLREFLGIWRWKVAGRNPLLLNIAYQRRMARRPRDARLLVTAVA